jgi:hypothetical protein
MDNKKQQTLFTLRFIPNSPAIKQVDSIFIINVASFVTESDHENSFRDFLKNSVAPLISSDDLISWQDLIHDVRGELGHSINLFSDELLIRIRDLRVRFTMFFKYLAQDQVVPYSRVSVRNKEIQSWNTDLYVRGGNVELKVVENALFGKLGDDFYPNIQNGGIESGIPLSNSKRRHWLDTSDVNRNIRDLMTNAGWYPNDNFEISELRIWADHYYRAYVNAHGIFEHNGREMYEILLERRKIDSVGKGFDYYRFPGREKFYELLKGANVLLVTPFAHEIQHLFESGKMWGLWKDLDIAKFQLTTIQAPISIYPNRPGKSWLESFVDLQETIQRSFAQNEHSLFFASAGAYGLPICDFVHSNFDIASVYDGNHVNYLFGVRQNSTENLGISSKRYIDNWAISDLGKIEGLAKIDGGRFVFNEESNT